MTPTPAPPTQLSEGEIDAIEARRAHGGETWHAIRQLRADLDRVTLERDDAVAGMQATVANMAQATTRVVALKDALRKCMIGGNHVATHIDLDGPDWHGSHDAALKHYGAGLRYDAWCCWKAIMEAGEALGE